MIYVYNKIYNINNMYIIKIYAIFIIGIADVIFRKCYITYIYVIKYIQHITY